MAKQNARSQNELTPKFPTNRNRNSKFQQSPGQKAPWSSAEVKAPGKDSQDSSANRGRRLDNGWRRSGSVLAVL